jgi:lipid A ethanolaminephosphotransferase
MIAALSFVLLSAAAWRRAIKPAAALFLLPAAAGAHFMGTYGVVIDPTMMTNVLQTNATETRDLISVRLLLSLLVIAALPIAWMWRRRVRQLSFVAQLSRNLGAMLAGVAGLAVLLFALFADLSATMRNHKSMRYLINPLNSFYALGTLAHQANAMPKGPPQPIGIGAALTPRAVGTRPPLLLLVVGETARSDHFSLNGYDRPTNPQLAALGVVSYRDVTSCGTNTAAALPCMFSHLGRTGHEARERDHENLLDLVQRAGLAVLWLDNQSGCKGLCERVPNAMASDGAPAALCNDGECLDEAMLHGLDARLAALDPQRRERGVLLVLHQMGSHGPAYWRRAPADRKPFQPECLTNVLQQCDRQALINAYDNSIAYTDHVLAQAIAWLGRQQTAYDPLLVYASDHGESLGENGLYLHGLPYAVAPREQTHVPMLVWLPAQTEQAAGLRKACLSEQRDRPLSHDHLFHTVSGVLGIRAGEYRTELDAFAACRQP